MQNGSRFAGKLIWLYSRLRVRPGLLIVITLSGGTAIAFPAASALVLAYIAFLLAALGIMAWTGLIALASAAAAALIVPVVTIVSVYGIIAGVRWFIRMTFSAPHAEEAAQSPQKVGHDHEGAERDSLQQSLDRWETEGGAAVPVRLRSSWRRAWRPASRILRTRPTHR
jgi:hypothetical protein